MKNPFRTARSRYIFALVVLAVGIGVISQKLISFPKECSPIKNQEITYLLKI